jgi:hypothetical protein
MSGHVVEIRSNIKPSYTTANGTFFVHGVTLDGSQNEYEYHSKSDRPDKVKQGTSIDYTTSKDAKGNLRIKLVAAPYGARGASTPARSQQTQAPAYTPPPGFSGPDRVTWLQVFTAICTLQSGTGKELAAVIKATDVVIQKHLPR